MISDWLFVIRYGLIEFQKFGRFVEKATVTNNQ
jgi:hypothetical protein